MKQDRIFHLSLQRKKEEKTSTLYGEMKQHISLYLKDEMGAMFIIRPVVLCPQRHGNVIVISLLSAQFLTHTDDHSMEDTWGRLLEEETTFMGYVLS